MKVKLSVCHVVVGDYLSFNNGKLAQETQADVTNREGRLEGLIMALTDFHAMMNLLDIVFKTSFTVGVLVGWRYSVTSFDMLLDKSNPVIQLNNL